MFEDTSRENIDKSICFVQAYLENLENTIKLSNI